MNQLEFLALIESTSVSLFDAPSTAERQRIVDEITGDPDLTAAVLMVLLESFLPLLPDPAPDPRQGLVQ